MKTIRLGCLDAARQTICVLQFVQVSNFSYEVVESDGWSTQDSSLCGHSLAISDIHRRIGQRTVNIGWIDRNPIPLEFSFKAPFRGNVYASVSAELRDEASGDLCTDSLSPGIVRCG